MNDRMIEAMKLQIQWGFVLPFWLWDDTMNEELLNANWPDTLVQSEKKTNATDSWKSDLDSVDSSE